MEITSLVDKQLGREDSLQQSFKRKRDEKGNNKIHDRGTAKENEIINVVKKQRKETVGSKLGTPVSTSTQVLQERDGNSILPRYKVSYFSFKLIN